MPWPLKQQRAIFLSTMRKKGKKAAVELMHEAGYGKDKPKRSPRKKKS